MTQGQILAVHKQVQCNLTSTVFILIYTKTEIGAENICKNLCLFHVDPVLMHR